MRLLTSLSVLALAACSGAENETAIEGPSAPDVQQAAMETVTETPATVSNELPTPEMCTEVAEFLKNLAHPQRLMILCLLSIEQNCS